MGVRELLPSSRVAKLRGYGMAADGDVYLYRPTTVTEVREIFDLARPSGRRIVLRGAGRSYGDANIAREAIAIDIQRMNRILSWDPGAGIIDCEAGVTIENLWRTALEDGFWPPVVSGTMYPTLAGALAMNIHGKNNFRVGTLGEHVLELDALFPSGELTTLRPEDDLFSAVISGAGLLGVITRVKMQMKRVHSGELDVLAVSPKNWDEQFALFEKFEADADYMVSWVDCFGRNRRRRGGAVHDGSGRGQFHAAWYRDDGMNTATLRPDRQDLPDTLMGFLPKSSVWRLLKPFNNNPGMNFVNWAKYKAGETLGNNKMEVQSLVGFSFLLDYVPNWRNAYLPGGFIQYQSFVPKDSAREVFARQIEMQQQANLESYLGVLKRHRPDRFLLSHAVDGYSLALDFKVTQGNWGRLLDLCHRMNDLVLAAGGRFYFAKDSTLRPSDLRAYLGEPTLARFFEVKRRVDPEGLLTSDLAQRLGLSKPT